MTKWSVRFQNDERSNVVRDMKLSSLRASTPPCVLCRDSLLFAVAAEPKMKVV